jgi:hypothetical protein
MRPALALGSGLLLAIVPVALRNFLETHNPFYPLFNHAFAGTALGPTLEGFYENFRAPWPPLSIPSELMAAIGELVRGSPIVLGLLALPFLIWRKTWPLQLKTLARSIIASFLLLVLLARNTIFWRLAGALPVIAPALGVVAFCLCIRNRKLALVIMAGLILAPALTNEQLVLSSFRVFQAPNPSLQIRADHKGGSAKAWLRMHASPSELIVSSGDSQIYYLTALNVLTLTDHPDFDRATSAIDDPVALVLELRSRGARYFLATWLERGLPWGKSMAILLESIQRNPECIAFDGHDAQVIDLDKLAQALAKQPAPKKEAPSSKKSDMAPVYTP